MNGGDRLELAQLRTHEVISGTKQWRSPAAVIGGSLALCVAVAFVPAEWSLVDDAASRTTLLANIEAHGLVGGIGVTIWDHALRDRDWGLFRPLYYVYAGVFYLSSPALAHAIRMGFFLLAVLGPAVVMTRRVGHGHPWAAHWVAALLLANTHLYQGLSFMSLQELTGIALASVGLAAQGPRHRGAWFLAAALIKAPFVWLSLCWSVRLLRRKETRAAGALLTGTGAGAMIASALAARSGDYTSTYAVSIDRFAATLREGLPLFGWPGVIGVLGLAAFRTNLARLEWRDPLTLALALGGLGYLATMLPWGLGAYYSSPPVWMLSVAGARLALSGSREPSIRWRPVHAALVVLCLITAGRLAWLMGGDQWERNATVVGLRDWATTLEPGDITIGVNGPEAALQLDAIMRLHDPSWDNSFVYVADAGPTPAGLDYFVALKDQGTGNPSLTRNPVKMLPRATVFDL